MKLNINNGVACYTEDKPVFYSLSNLYPTRFEKTSGTVSRKLKGFLKTCWPLEVRIRSFSKPWRFFRLIFIVWIIFFQRQPVINILYLCWEFSVANCLWIQPVSPESFQPASHVFNSWVFRNSKQCLKPKQKNAT